MSELFLSTWGGSRRTNGGGTGQFQRADLTWCAGSNHTPSSNTSCCFTDFSVEVNYRSALKRQHGGRMHEGERSDYWVWKDTYTYRERESSGECLKSGWQSSLSLRYLSSLHASCSSHLPCSSSFAKSFFPQMLAHHFFFSCLVLLSLSLSLSVNLFPSVSLRLSLSVSSLYSHSRAAVPHICSCPASSETEGRLCLHVWTLHGQKYVDALSLRLFPQLGLHSLDSIKRND